VRQRSRSVNKITLPLFEIALVLVRLDHDAFLSAKRLQEILTTFLAIRRFGPSTRTMAAIHGKCAPHAGQILVSLVISFPQWQMSVPFAMRLPTMKSGMPTIAPTTVQQSSRPITCRPTPHAAVLRGFSGSDKGRGRGGKVLWIGTVTTPLQFGHGAVMPIWSRVAERCWPHVGHANLMSAAF